MITVKFKGQPLARVIIADKPIVSSDSVVGIIECSVCSMRDWLYSKIDNDLACEIENFIKSHKCEFLSRKEETIQYAKRLQELMPKYHVHASSNSGKDIPLN